MRRFRSFLAVLAAGCASAVVGVQPALATPTGPTLEGENLHASLLTPGTSTQTSGTSSCDVAGTSTVHFTASGIATGPFPGTFTASGTVTIGPQTPPGTTSSLLAGSILSFEERFTIQSGETTVTGTKTVYHGPIFGGEAGTCHELPPGVEPHLVGGGGARIMSVHAFTQYEATISGPLGTYTDSGLAISGAADWETLGGITLIRSFGETFLFSFNAASTPGHATGGGQVDDVDGSPGVTFGFTARADEDGRTKGACSIVEHAGVHVRCTTVDTYLEIGNTATITGEAMIDNEPTRYRMEVVDNAEPGVGSDTFSFQTDTGYTVGGVLTEGNVQVHRN